MSNSKNGTSRLHKNVQHSLIDLQDIYDGQEYKLIRQRDQKKKKVNYIQKNFYSNKNRNLSKNMNKTSPFEKITHKKMKSSLENKEFIM